MQIYQASMQYIGSTQAYPDIHLNWIFLQCQKSIYSSSTAKITLLHEYFVSILCSGKVFSPLRISSAYSCFYFIFLMKITKQMLRSNMEEITRNAFSYNNITGKKNDKKNVDG